MSQNTPKIIVLKLDDASMKDNYFKQEYLYIDICCLKLEIYDMQVNINVQHSS
jgi:hypothetical protein